jgi:tetratricopeptide (TPR) repeat protein
VENPKSEIPNYAPNDLSFYANIPTPCSYMCMGTEEDFFGGYDHFQQAGIIHIASHHISPGKKQWTWGNHAFGYAWDRNLTDPDAHGEYGPYIELMAGVYTDNQPDFSFLQPGETKTWSQHWYPIQKIGPARIANLNAAVALGIPTRGKLRLGIVVTADRPKATVVLSAKGKKIARFKSDLVPGTPVIRELRLPNGVRESDLSVRVQDHGGVEIISGRIKPRSKAKVPPPATEPRAPASISGADELFVTGLHLEQYRHATRCPTLYWREALRRDPLDSRCNNAMGRWHLRRGEFQAAEHHFRRAIERLTRRNPNPYDGEPFHNLGLCLRHLNRDAEAYDAFYKSTWNQAWVAAGYHALAEIDCARKNWTLALEHLGRSLRFNADNLRARNLKVIVLRRLKRRAEADVLLAETLALDPLDWWARHLAGRPLECDLQTALDLAHDFARAGFFNEAIMVLGSNGREADSRLEEMHDRRESLPTQSLGAAPLVQYTIGWLAERSGDSAAGEINRRGAALLPADYCFPSRLEEIEILEAAMRANPKDARAPYYLGNLLYDRRRHREAIQLWERSARLDPDFSVVWRNLGIGYFNIHRSPARARAAYDRAFKAEPGDARVLFERDQLWKRFRESPARRLRELGKHPELVAKRDDLSVELCALYNQTGQPGKALAILSERKFQPWEGGEGQALSQHVRTHLALGRDALAHGDVSEAQKHFESALASPENLSEAKHLLANQSDIHYWLGLALTAVGDWKGAREQWLAAATFKGDFQEMSVRAFSGMTYYSALAWAQLGHPTKARRLLNELLAYGRKLQRARATVDYFATSLPAMLLFDDDLQFRQETTAVFLQAQAHLGLGNRAKARSLLAQVLRRDPSHAPAADLMSEAAETTVRVRRAKAADARPPIRVKPFNRSGAAYRSNGQLADNLL